MTEPNVINYKDVGDCRIYFEEEPATADSPRRHSIRIIDMSECLVCCLTFNDMLTAVKVFAAIDSEDAMYDVFMAPEGGC